MLHRLDIDWVRKSFTAAYEALCAQPHEGWESFDDMYEDTDLLFFAKDGELYIQSRDEQVLAVWRADRWQDQPFE